MGSLGALAIGLSVVFVVFLLILAAEIYYLICWKKTRNSSAQRINLLQEDEEEMELREASVIANRNEGFHGDLSSTKLFPVVSEVDTDMGHYRMGPARFLFTIREETEEIESETVKSRNGSVDFTVLRGGLCLSEPGTPFLTPPSSPSVLGTPPMTPSSSAIRALAREPPVYASSSSPQWSRSLLYSNRRMQRTTMMMLLHSGTSPPGTPPAAYRPPPTHSRVLGFFWIFLF